MPRHLDTATLRGFARDAARNWISPDMAAPNGGKLWRAGPSWVIQSMYNFDFKDEFETVRQLLLEEFLAPSERAGFEERAKKVFTPRDDKVFHGLLRERLAISPEGDHIDGCIGKVDHGARVVARRSKLVRRPILRRVDPDDPSSEWKIVGYREHSFVKPVYWPVYAGEGEERAAGRIKARVGDPGPGADPLPETAEPLPVGANVPTMSAECAILALDAIVDNLDEGSTAATIRGRSGAQPADPDAAETGTLLFTLTMSATAFNAAVDDTDGTVSATAAAITDDSSADATGTLGYCRAGATGTGADDHLDGEAGTSGADFNFNTVSIVSGSTVSMTSLVAGLSQGSTAT